MPKTYLILDDFYADASHVRELALHDEHWLPAKQERGKMFVSETRRCYYHDGLVQRLQHLVGTDIVVDPRRRAFGAFSLSTCATETLATTHYDDTDWSMIIYLSEPVVTPIGIELLRHRATGLAGPPSDEEAHSLGFPGGRDHWLQDVYLQDKWDPGAWDCVGIIGMRFNRGVVLRGGRLFHRASAGYGAGVADGRLTQRFFFNEA